jgi:hypothetical protein
MYTNALKKVSKSAGSTTAARRGKLIEIEGKPSSKGSDKKDSKSDKKSTKATTTAAPLSPNDVALAALAATSKASYVLEKTEGDAIKACGKVDIKMPEPFDASSLIKAATAMKSQLTAAGVTDPKAVAAVAAAAQAATAAQQAQDALASAKTARKSMSTGDASESALAAQAKLLKQVLAAKVAVADLVKEIKEKKEEMAKHITKAFGKFMPKAAVKKLAKVWIFLLFEFDFFI